MASWIWGIILVVAVIAAVLITAVVVSGYQKKVAASTIGSAEDKAREIIDDALKTAEAKKRESMLEIKEESIRTKNELDKEIKEIEGLQKRISELQALPEEEQKQYRRFDQLPLSNYTKQGWSFVSLST